MITKEEAYRIINVRNDDAHAYAYDEWVKADEMEEDDDIQDYKQPLDLNPYRNMVIEAVAQEIEKFTFAFGVDTVQSFAAFVRGFE